MGADSGPDPDAAARLIGEALAAIYRRADAAMRDLPIYNPALDVAALGFRDVDGAALGVVVTPWFMNLVRVPPRGVVAPPPGTVVPRALPVGVLDFTIGVLDDVAIESCSLVSPMHDFVDQQQAESTALAALAVVLTPAEQAGPSFMSAGAAEQAGSGEPIAHAAPSLDRRRFLRGALTERRP
ncbi:hydrogenase expression/formation protein HupJ [Rhodopseudomonas sp. AAP120]|uniref:[NiFe]-hydrogenase assembly chaperone HybE n=1 Tax=Rhodopseudomonas sp. AAP120 TaxID=1523430 RepID=UPI0006B88E78|nr:[NiFe]-hydrogenase assembly chaperone HybE [Rhodopseudomonas sp. AAP120]KPG00844.1 hydrogenase expression/formation protein HupJ [Rhodopseudomonas sp. AAP120]